MEQSRASGQVLEAAVVYLLGLHRDRLALVRFAAFSLPLRRGTSCGVTAVTALRVTVNPTGRSSAVQLIDRWKLAAGEDSVVHQLDELENLKVSGIPSGLWHLR